MKSKSDREAIQTNPLLLEWKKIYEMNSLFIPWTHDTNLLFIDENSLDAQYYILNNIRNVILIQIERCELILSCIVINHLQW